MTPTINSRIALSCVLGVLCSSFISQALSLPISELGALCDFALLTGCGTECRNGCSFCGSTCDANQTHILELYLPSANLTKIPTTIGNLPMLTYLYLYSNTISTIPEVLFNLTRINYLSFYVNQIRKVPDSIGNLRLLTYLDLDRNELSSLPDSIGNLPLKTLYTNKNQIGSYPTTIGSLSKIVYIATMNNKLSSLPDSIGKLATLTYFDAENNIITSLPETIGNMKSLTFLGLNNNFLNAIPSNFGSLSKLKILTIYKNLLKEIPETFGNLSSLSYLEIQSNSLTSLPNSIGRLKSLSHLDTSYNTLKTLPESFGTLSNLIYLDISYNSLSSLPSTFKSLTVLSTLIMENNCLNCSQFIDWPLIFQSSCVSQKETCDDDGSDTKGISPMIISYIVIGGFVVLIAFVACFIFYIRKAHLRVADKSREGLHMGLFSDLQLPLISSSTTGIIVKPTTLSFGSSSAQVPVGQLVHDTFTIKGESKKKVNFKIVLPDDNPDKFNMKASVVGGETSITKGKEITVDVSLCLLCTTRLEVEIVIVLNESGCIVVKVQAEGRLSTKLDADELEMGNIIGTGSFGTVYKGCWRNLVVAIKSYNESIVCDEMCRRGIENEVEMCSALRHPNVVMFYGRATLPSKYFIVMEFVKLGSLGGIVKTKQLDMAFKIRVSLDIAKGMMFLHSNGIIHRDLKTDNVLVESLEPKAPVCGKLSDFNTSRFTGSDMLSTRTKGVGTPAFMSPEVLSGEKYDFKADVFSFGMILWNLWTQLEPYEDFKNKFTVFKFVGEGKRLPIPSSIPRSLRELTESSWANDPLQRPTFSELVQLLEHEIEPQSSSPTPPPS